MVSVTDPPAASAAVVRRVTKAPAGALNDAEYRPAAFPGVTCAGCQLFPSSKDTATAALTIAGVAASCRCPMSSPICWRPGGVAPPWLSPATWYPSVIIGCTAHRWVSTRPVRAPVRQAHGGGTIADGSRCDLHCHVVVLAGDRM